VTFHSGGGSASGGAGVDDPAGLRVGGGPPPWTITLITGDLAGDIGDHRAEPDQLTGILSETGQGGEIDPELHPTALNDLILATTP
jgi:hypothetical protein